jgi:aspartyl-tRNA(Asn)/glutamyl-tRNA(Gln) amidotransferase subunit C
MEINDKLVDHLAHLSRLTFEGQAKVEIKKDMEKILGFMDKLSELDTDNVEPLIYVNDEADSLRDDIAVVTLTQKEALKNGPKKDSDYFKVPRVLEK